MGKKIYMIGDTIENFVGRKLPSLKEVMALFFHHHNSENKTIKESASITINKVYELWEKVEIPTRQKRSSILKLIGCHSRWQNLKKNINRKKSPTQKKKESLYCQDLIQLFDVSHHDVLNRIDENKKLFFMGQKSLTRRGFIDNDPAKVMEMNKDMDINEKIDDNVDNV